MSDNEKETIPTNKKDGGGDATSGKKAAGDTEKDTAGTSTDGSAPAMPIISPGANPMTMGQVPTAMMSGQFAPNMMDFSAATEPSAQLAAQAMMRKRQLEMAGDDFAPTVGAKRAKAEEDASKQASDGGEREDAASPNSYPHNTPIPASKEGIKFYSRNDVLCGRGGGTNVHPGNRRFRDLINANRRAYLKARKNDKPAISRSIVRTIREMNGRFLKKDEKQGLWYEVGDDGAREKTSQALRQRAPEMRKILFEDEQRQQHAHQEAMMQRQLMGQGMHPGMMGQGMQMQGMQGRMGMHPGMMGGMNMGGMNPGMMGGMNPGMMGGMMGGMNPGMMGGGMGMGMGMGMGTMNAENFATMSSMQANAGMTNGMPSAGGNGVGEDPQAMMTKYNMLQQKNLLAQEKAMLMQRLAGISNQQNSIDNLSQGTKNPGAVV